MNARVVVRLIFYFSGTGNSRYAARLIAGETDDHAVSMGDVIKSGGVKTYHSEKPLVFVCPTYAWRIPRVVEQFIQKSRFEGSRLAYFVLTCGGHAGNAARYAAKLSAAKSWTFMGLNAVVMPENYIALFEVPDKAQSEMILKNAVPKILDIAGRIRDGKVLAPDRVTPAGRFLSAAVNPLFYPVIVSARGFYATDACTGCGRCAALCPLNNVTLDKSRPVWGKRCTHCMACICACPAEAIEYKNASKGKPRYYLPDTAVPQK